MVGIVQRIDQFAIDWIEYKYAVYLLLEMQMIQLYFMPYNSQNYRYVD